MSTKSGTVIVGDEAVSLVLADDADQQLGSRWTAYNAGDNIIWVGDKDVEVGDGIPIPVGGYASETFQAGDTLYGIAEDDTQLNVKQDGV